MKTKPTLEELQANNWIVPFTPAERAYWKEHNPLNPPKSQTAIIDDRTNQIADKSAKRDEAIEHVKSLIQSRIDAGERYFNAMSERLDLIYFRQDIVRHFAKQDVDLSIRKGGYIFVHGGIFWKK
jgi:hypothetical protein